MKKIFSLLLILAMLFSMAACSSGNDNTTDSSDQNEPLSTENDVSDPTSENNNRQTEDNSNLSNASSQDSDSFHENAPSQEEGFEAPDENSGTEQGSNILVAYFSRVGNTDWESGVDAVTSASLNVIGGEYFGNAQLLAGMAQEVTGGDLFLIQTEETYPSGYRDTTDIAKKEQNEDARPALASHVENMDQYDTIVLIFPNWWGTIPMPLYTFLEEYDFSGKTILPLCTHEGSAMGSSARAIVNLCPGANLLNGLAVRGSNASSAQSDVESWINNSGILQ